MKSEPRREVASLGLDDVKGPSERIRRITVYALQVPLAQSVYNVSRFGGDMPISAPLA